MNAGYDIYQRGKSDRVTWVANVLTRAEALNELRTLCDTGSEDCTYLAVNVISCEELTLPVRCAIRAQ